MDVSELITPALVLAVGGFLWRELRRVELRLEGKIAALDGKMDGLAKDHAGLSTRLGRIEGHLLGREALELPAD